MPERRTKRPIDYSVYGSGEDLGLSDDDDFVVSKEKAQKKLKAKEKPKPNPKKESATAKNAKKRICVNDSDNEEIVEIRKPPISQEIKEPKIPEVAQTSGHANSNVTSKIDSESMISSELTWKADMPDVLPKSGKTKKESNITAPKSVLKVTELMAKVDSVCSVKEDSDTAASMPSVEYQSCEKAPPPSLCNKWKPEKSATVESPVLKLKWTPPGPIGTQRNDVNSGGLKSVVRMGLSRNYKLTPLHPLLKSN